MLELKDVNTNRGPAHILHNVSLRVGKNEAVCLVGRNGAGKTTTIESIMGLLPVRSGTIVLGGRDITRLPTHGRARLGVGYAPEDAGIFPDLTVAENFQISLWLAQPGRNGSSRKTPTAEVEERIFAMITLSERPALTMPMTLWLVRTSWALPGPAASAPSSKPASATLRTSTGRTERALRDRTRPSSM